MQNSDWATIFRYLDGLGAYFIATGAYLDTQGDEPKLGSKAAEEIALFPGNEIARMPYRQALLLIESIADHGHALIRTLQPPRLTITPWTCLRIMLEASVIGHWLMDTSIEGIVRIERGMSLRRAQLEQQRKAIIAGGNDDESARIMLRFEKLNAEARELGIEPVKEMPTITALACSLLQEESSFRILSAMLHGQYWALTQLAFRRADPSDPRILEKHLEPWQAEYLIYKAAYYFAVPVWDLARLHSFDIKELKRIWDAGYDSIGMHAESELRFWH